jgi:hypothetical protein
VGALTIIPPLGFDQWPDCSQAGVISGPICQSCRRLFLLFHHLNKEDEEDKHSLLSGNRFQKGVFRTASALLGRGPGLMGVHNMQLILSAFTFPKPSRSSRIIPINFYRTVVMTANEF